MRVVRLLEAVQEGATGMNTHSLTLMERLQEAQNQHDLEAFVACFAPDYRSEQPLHPDRAFVGREQVRKNWSVIFKNVPDLRSELIRAASGGDTVWAEWRWSGIRLDGERFNLRGVTIMGVQNVEIAWGRLYMEPVQETGEGVDAAVREMTRDRPQGE
jgi:ketosteroid isomerase-like protein